MTNNLIMQLKVERAKAQKELDEMKIKVVRLLNEIASKSCPFFENFEDIEAAEIEQAADELLKVKNEAIELNRKLQKINKELD